MRQERLRRSIVKTYRTTYGRTITDRDISPKEGRGLSPTSGSLAQGSHIRKVNLQNIWL